jgi:hypothetical protein
LAILSDNEVVSGELKELSLETELSKKISVVGKSGRRTCEKNDNFNFYSKEL